MAGALPILLVLAVGLCLSLVVFALWNSLRGLLAHAGNAPSARAALDTGRAALLSEKEELLAAIRELKFEHELGKVSEGDFQRLDLRYRTRAREVLRDLDQQIAPFRAQARALLDTALVEGPPASARAARAPGGDRASVRAEWDEQRSGRAVLQEVRPASTR